MSISKDHAWEIYNKLVETAGLDDQATTFKNIFRNLSQADRKIVLKALEIINNPSSNKILNLQEKSTLLINLTNKTTSTDLGITPRLISNYFKNSITGKLLGLNGIESEMLWVSFEKTVQKNAFVISAKTAAITNQEMREQINSQQNIPIMQTAISKLNATCDKLNFALTKDDLGQIERELEVQHKNLVTLSNILQKKISENDKKFLMQLYIQPSETNQYGSLSEGGKKAGKVRLKFKITTPHINEEALSPYINGKKLLDPEAESRIVKLIQEELNKVSENSEFLQEEFKKLEGEDNSKPLLQDLKQKRIHSGISNFTIEAQSALFNASRQAKELVAEQSSLTAREGSANFVVGIQSKREKVAFYKEGKGGEKAAGIMEKLMWDMALIMGFEELFTATKETNLQTKERSYQGGIQAAQKGIKLAEYVKTNGPRLNQDHLNKATLATIVFGMFDAHGDNILVDEKGNIKFFDNTRSMPNSNGVILYYNSLLLIPYRSSLLGLDESLINLIPSEREKIKEEIQRCKQQVAKLEQFLNSPITKAQTAKLPPGWWNQEDAIVALKERINNLERAIESSEVKNLRDLVFASNPDLKFFAAMESLLNLTKSSETKLTPARLKSVVLDTLGELGSKTVTELIEEVSQLKVDPEELRQLCLKPELSLENILIATIKNQKNNVKTNNEEKTRTNNTKNLIQEYKNKAKFDFKDIELGYIKQTEIPEILKKLRNNGLITQKLTSDEIQVYFKDKKHTNVIAKDTSNPPKLTLHYRTDQGFIKAVNLNYMVKRGALKIGNLLVTPEELNKAFMNKEKPAVLSPLQIELGIFS